MRRLSPAPSRLRLRSNLIDEVVASIVRRYIFRRIRRFQCVSGVGACENLSAHYTCINASQHTASTRAQLEEANKSHKPTTDNVATGGEQPDSGEQTFEALLHSTLKLTHPHPHLHQLWRVGDIFGSLTSSVVVFMNQGQVRSRCSTTAEEQKGGEGKRERKRERERREGERRPRVNKQAQHKNHASLIQKLNI